MIERLWHGWTKRENAAANEKLLLNEILPGSHRVDGYWRAHLLRREGKGEEEGGI
jgi:hypothetical protein